MSFHDAKRVIAGRGVIAGVGCCERGRPAASEGGRREDDRHHDSRRDQVVAAHLSLKIKSTGSSHEASHELQESSTFHSFRAPGDAATHRIDRGGGDAMALTALIPSRASTAAVRVAHPRCPRTHRGRAANLQRTTRHLPTPRRITWVAASSSSNDDGEMVDSTRSFDPHALRVRHFINLKNGIEAVPTLHAMNVHDYAFCRVQSTMCEAG